MKQNCIGMCIAAFLLCHGASAVHPDGVSREPSTSAKALVKSVNVAEYPEPFDFSTLDEAVASTLSSFAQKDWHSNKESLIEALVSKGYIVCDFGDQEQRGKLKQIEAALNGRIQTVASKNPENLSVSLRVRLFDKRFGN